MNDEQLKAARERARNGRVVVLTGAGISAESGVPTFRGPEGYWTVGSRHHRPEELATWATFSRDPELVWPWYLHRRRVCRAAAPNAGHLALTGWMAALGARGTLITQNVDGLHRRATVDGAPPPRLFEIHGNLDLMRPADNANVRLSVPKHFDAPRTEGEQTALSDEDRALLRAPDGGWYRPHVLWFDETYDEENYRFESSIRAATEADLLITVGTTAGTNLPRHVVGLALRNGALLIDVNIADNDFADAARASGGLALTGRSGELLPPLVQKLRGA